MYVGWRSSLRKNTTYLSSILRLSLFIAADECSVVLCCADLCSVFVLALRALAISRTVAYSCSGQLCYHSYNLWQHNIAATSLPSASYRISLGYASKQGNPRFAILLFASNTLPPLPPVFHHRFRCFPQYLYTCWCIS
jgi:hypothetical protein